MNKTPLVSICLPTYNSQDIIKRTLDNIIAQNYPNLEIIICDDASTDQTVKVIRSLNIPQVKLHVNPQNLGYADNLANFPKLAKGEIIFLMAQDDLIINDGLKQTINCFSNPQVSLVTRPYYWFIDDLHTPIRHIPPLNTNHDVLIDINKNPQYLIPIIETIGQLSGLAYRCKDFTKFDPFVFTSHIRPFLQILIKHKCVFLKDYTIAVSTTTSQTRFKSSIYDISPHQTWMEMFNSVFALSPHLKCVAIDHMSRNNLGLIQIKNYSSYRNLFREIFLMIRSRPQNLITPSFLFYCLLTIFTPRPVLKYLVDLYKNTVLKKQLDHKITINLIEP